MSSRLSRDARFLPRLLQLEDRATPATFTVTNLNDSGLGSLREAIAQANDEVNHPGPDTVAFAATLQGGTVGLTTFSNPTFGTVTVPQPAGPSALMVTSAVTIAGTGETLSRSLSGTAFRLFQVTASGNLTLRNLTLRNGSAQGSPGGAGGGGAAGLGGAIYNQGTLTVRACTLTANQAIGGATTGGGAGGGGGLGGPGGSGGFAEGGGRGGLPNSGAAFGGGGGLVGQPNGGAGGFGGGGGLGFIGGTGGFGAGGGSGNSVGGPGGFGGGDGGNLLTRDTPGASLGEGGSGMGGALFNQGGSVAISNSTITGNVARGGDAPTAQPGQSGGAFGGGLFNLNGSLTLTGATLAGNTVTAGATAFGEQAVGTADGGELSSMAADVGADTATQTAVVTFTNCIVSHTGPGSTLTLFRGEGSSTLNAIGPNIVYGIVYNLGGVVTGTPFTITDPRLNPLAENGGLTPTMVPQAGSPAIDSGSNTADGLTRDQRGRNYVRLFNGTVDIGAVEVQPQPPPTGAAVAGQMDGTARMLNPANEQYALGDALNFFQGSSVNVRTATADLNGDGVADFIGGTGPGRVSQVTVFDGKTHAAIASWQPFEGGFTGSVYVVAADLDGDGKAEVIVSPDQGGGPIIATYSGAKLSSGVTGDAAQLTRFFGIEDPSFRGGARPTLGDVNGDGSSDLVVSAGFLGGPRIAVFDGKGLAAGSSAPRHLVADFFAFENTLRNGAFVTAGDVTGDGFADLVFGGGPGGAPRVRLFDGKQLLSATGFSSLDDIGGAQKSNFFAGGADLRGGVRLALRDTNEDGKADLVTGSGEGEVSRVRVFLSANLLANIAPTPDQELDPFAGAVMLNGVFVG